LTLDDDVAALLKRARRERGQSLQEYANALLRRTLERLGASAAKPSAAGTEVGTVEPATADLAERQTGSAEPYRIRPFSSGRCLLDDLDNVAEVLASAEGEDFR
ncbi:MAG: hypothetical protein GY856_08580, partial [bacterium]|nr:hypothetical protein [bacterium]